MFQNQRVCPIVCPPQVRCHNNFIPREIPVIHPIVNVNVNRFVDTPRHEFVETTRDVWAPPIRAPFAGRPPFGGPGFGGPGFGGPGFGGPSVAGQQFVGQQFVGQQFVNRQMGGRGCGGHGMPGRPY